MPNSLKCRLKKLKHQGLLSEKDLSRIYTDNDVTEELEKIKAEIMATGNWKSEYEISDRGVIKAVEVIDNHISELKGENK